MKGAFSFMLVWFLSWQLNYIIHQGRFLGSDRFDGLLAQPYKPVLPSFFGCHLRIVASWLLGPFRKMPTGLSSLQLTSSRDRSFPLYAGVADCRAHLAKTYAGKGTPD